MTTLQQPSGHSAQNRLASEKSPYLLQHANNPVDWYPWGEEAFKKSKDENKPIFLSIGYSTCHWCHVMEEESFENQEVADLLNKSYVSIKVDREERPDVDAVYMQAVQRMTGSGGWPLSVFLTPDKEPFFGGTYFPPEDAHGRPGFKSVLASLALHWSENPERVLQTGRSMAKRLRDDSTVEMTHSANLDTSILKRAYESYEQTYDARYGGFGQAPKFPRPHQLGLLMRYWKRSGEKQALQMAENTLREMAKGGIYDHLGGGFHRYSTDEKWHVPHFEKMLYDQALLTHAYLEAFQITGNPLYERIIRETFDYVLRDMTSRDGVFYSAEDADSVINADRPDEKAEGAFYVWEQKEIDALLGKERAEIFSYLYGVEAGGNAENDPHGEFPNKNILYRARTYSEAGKPFGKTEPEVRSLDKESKQILFKARSKRIRPHLDDKVLTDWNALMISSLAYGGLVLGETRYRDAAQKAADFLLSKMKTQDGRLMHRYREGKVAIEGFLDDYAFFSYALQDLYVATQDPRYLEESIGFANQIQTLFKDPSGGYFLTSHDAEKLIVRTKDYYDGAIPSGNSVALLAFLRLGRITTDSKYTDWAAEALNSFSNQIMRHPTAFPQSLAALDFLLGPSREIVIAGDPESLSARKMVDALFAQYLPKKVVVFHPEAGSGKDLIEGIAPFIKYQLALNGETTAYVCRNHVCQLPTTKIEKFIELLSR